MACALIKTTHAHVLQLHPSLLTFLICFFISSLMCSHIHARTCLHEQRKAQSSHTCTPAPPKPPPPKNTAQHPYRTGKTHERARTEPSETNTNSAALLSLLLSHTRARTLSTPPLFPALVNRVRIHKPPTSHPKHLPAKPYLSLSP